jgi:hypothetical protein
LERTPKAILEEVYGIVESNPDVSHLPENYEKLAQWLQQVIHSERTQAFTRALLACLLAKVDKGDDIDIRHPYTEIPEKSYSGRHYDEEYIGEFCVAKGLKANLTTAFLTPALRTKNTPLTRGVSLSSKDSAAEQAFLEILSAVEEYNGDKAEFAKSVLKEAIRLLYQKTLTHQKTLEDLLQKSTSQSALSIHRIMNILKKHLKSERSSRLPVLMIAACYAVAEKSLGKHVRKIARHTAADVRTGTLGDVEIECVGADGTNVIVYEIKMRPLSVGDLKNALEKVRHARDPISQYVFIVNSPPKSGLTELLNQPNLPVEFLVFDCLSFVEHFLHIFHESRMEFLEKYKELLLNEPDSSVSYALKKAFLVLWAEEASSESGLSH